MKNIIKLLIKDEVQHIFDHFCSLLNIRVLFYSASGEIVKVGLNRPNSTYCTLIQDRLYGRSACLDVDKSKREEALQKKSTICYHCHSGLTEALTPIFSDQYLLGYIGFGQIRTSDTLPANVLKDWSRSFDPAELKKSYLALPYFTPDKIADIRGLFSVLIKYIVKNNLITMKGDLLLQKIINYISHRMAEPIYLNRVAEYVDRSESTISHLFKKKLGKSFKRTVIDMKIEKAEEYLRTIPNVKISEVAEKVGYEDPLYFSRLYKKYRNRSPKSYQKIFQNV